MVSSPGYLNFVVTHHLVRSGHQFQSFKSRMVTISASLASPFQHPWAPGTKSQSNPVFPEQSTSGWSGHLHNYYELCDSPFHFKVNTLLVDTMATPFHIGSGSTRPDENISKQAKEIRPLYIQVWQILEQLYLKRSGETESKARCTNQKNGRCRAWKRGDLVGHESGIWVTEGFG